jgi:hypothetical protein
MRVMRLPSSSRRPCATFVAAAALAHAAFCGSGRAQSAEEFAPDRPEPGSVERIREYTTAPEYLPRSVAYVPDSDRVPSPAEVLGHEVGAPGELSNVATIHAYFRKLAATSDRVRVETIGTSEEGREILAVERQPTSPERNRQVSSSGGWTLRQAVNSSRS